MDFIPADPNVYLPFQQVQRVNVTRSLPTLDWEIPQDWVSGQDLDASFEQATASVAGTFTYTLPSSGRNLTGQQQVEVTFTPADPAFLPVTTQRTFTVVADRSNIREWALSYGLPPGDPLSVGNADASGDGQPNFVAFARGLDPRLPITSSMVLPSAAGQGFRFRLSKNHPEVVVTPQFSTNIEDDWATEGLILNTVEDDGEFVTYEARFEEPPTGVVVFGRLMMTYTPRNDPPSGQITSPTDGDSFGAGQALIFTATANDPDGDLVTYSWKLYDANNQLVTSGSAASFTPNALNPGAYEMDLEVTDADLST
jgi:hypothetical protein